MRGKYAQTIALDDQYDQIQQNQNQQDLQDQLAPPETNDIMREENSKILAQYGDNVQGLGTYIVNPGIEIDWTQYARCV